MMKHDLDQPNVFYTAEQRGVVYRIDLRSNIKDIIFEHSREVYTRSSVYDCVKDYAVFPTWSQPGSVKVILQNPTVSSPHMIIGGKGYIVGLVDLRSVKVTGSMGNGSVVNPFLKMWSPAFDSRSRNSYRHMISEYYSQLSFNHPFSCSMNISGASSLSREDDSPKQRLSSSPSDCISGVNAEGLTGNIDEGEVEISEKDETGEEYYDDEGNGESAPLHGTSSLERTSASGLQVSRDGRRLLVNFQSDQIYTFNFQSDDVCSGAEAIIGGHINHDTFLKSVNFFGPNDEYVVAGSDTGHMWIWESQPTTIEYDLGDSKRNLSTCCKLIGIFKAGTSCCCKLS